MGRSRGDGAVWKAASSKNLAVIFARDPGKMQTKASTPRPADGGHGRAFEGGALLSIVRGRGGKGRHRRGGNGAEQRPMESGKGSGFGVQDGTN